MNYYDRMAEKFETLNHKASKAKDTCDPMRSFKSPCELFARKNNDHFYHRNGQYPDRLFR